MTEQEIIDIATSIRIKYAPELGLATEPSTIDQRPVIEFAKEIEKRTLQAVIDQGNHQYSLDAEFMDDFVLTLVEWCKQWLTTGVKPPKD